MASPADGGAKTAGLEALIRLKSTEPPLFLTPSPELSKAARLASEYLFASLNPYAPKSPFSHLLTEGFDAEQIWQQIDLQAKPMLSSLRRQVRSFEKNPSEIEKQLNFEKDSGKEGKLREDEKNKQNNGVESESDDFDEDEVDEEEEEEDEQGEEEKEDEEGDDDDDDDDEDMDNEEGKKVNGLEDKFLKIKELEEYLVEDEAREYGLKKDKKKDKKRNKRKRGGISDEEEDDDDEEEGDEDDGDEDDEDDEDEFGLMGLEDDDGSMNARYEDFFTSKKGSNLKKKSKYDDELDDMDMDEPDNDDGNQEQGELRAKVEEMENANMQGKTYQSLSTHEKELEKRRVEIEEMERANMEPKAWNMQGEVTAAERKKNSALEVDIDFDHNAIPAPVQTVAANISIEELIQKRIVEGQFDDVQKPPTLLNKAPREKKELDENKSKKGLAELYEEEFAQKTGLVSTAMSFSDEQKKEASMLFKKLCVKLDALSHFHFAPKPVIEDMSIQANVPALAMEEVAPLAVSDAAMLAPEEVFSGKGDIKEETELTKADRKRRRAKKKRQFKAESVKRMTVKAQLSTLKKPDNVAGDGDS